MVVKAEEAETNPTIAAIFSGDPERQAAVNHVDYLFTMGNKELTSRVLQKLRKMFPVEIAEYGEKEFKILLSECSDRRILFRLINGLLTLDQFIVRVTCETKGIKYFCKDDLIKTMGVSPHFFEDLGAFDQYMDYLKEADAFGDEGEGSIKTEVTKCGITIPLHDKTE